eukprot:scaffold1314_cov145-Skeletonema_menzelii.AAC.2
MMPSCTMQGRYRSVCVENLLSFYRYRIFLPLLSSATPSAHTITSQLLSTKQIDAMNYLFVALSLLIVNRHACFGFTASGWKRSTTTSVHFLQSQSSDSPENLVDSSISITAADPKRAISRDTQIFNGPRAALAAAIVNELCREHLALDLEGELDEDDLLDECFIQT